MNGRMKKPFRLFVLLISLTLLLSACAGGPTAVRRSAASDLMADVQAQEWPLSPEPPDEDAVAALNRFADGLLRLSAGKDENVMISPASVYLALAMTLQGAGGDTADAMMEVLADTGLTLDELNRTARSLITAWATSDSGAKLSLANSIWFDDMFEAKETFLQTNADYFAADIRKLDFQDQKTIGRINEWVKNATAEKITEIVDEIDPDVIMYLINAVYFRADWEVEFEKEDTYERLFQTGNGEKPVDFMHRIGSIADISTDNTVGIALPYKNPDYVFFAIMPAEATVSPSQWLASVPEAELFTWIGAQINTAQMKTISLAMPRFELSYESSLKDALTALGMGIAFAPGQADFSNMQASGEKNLYIGEVKHKTFIRVDEKGTEAAAVTSVEIRVTSMPGFDKEIVLDRPFIYGILHLPTRVPLFTGVMADPS